MRKVIGIGETILDILFRNDQPFAAVPGGSTLNAIVSLSRLGVATDFISETGDDHVSEIIRRFLTDNGIGTQGVYTYVDHKSPISLAFLSDSAEASYSFYKNYPEQRLLDATLPSIHPDDVIIIGSYYAVTPALREIHLQLLGEAQKQGAIIYYDPNFRKPHRHEALKLAPYILENLKYASIVRGSEDDFDCLFNLSGAEKIYDEKIKFFCPRFIHTSGSGPISLLTPGLRKEYQTESFQPVSTVGAGDNFNAGLIYGLISNRIGLNDLDYLKESDWDKLIKMGQMLSKEVCMSTENYISVPFGKKIQMI